MKQKLRNLSAPANIIFAILAVFIFIAPLQWSGKVLGLIPGMEKADDYLLQAIVETVVLVIFLGITYIFGLWDIFKENAAGWTRSLYTPFGASAGCSGRTEDVCKAQADGLDSSNDADPVCHHAVFHHLGRSHRACKRFARAAC